MRTCTGEGKPRYGGWVNPAHRGGSGHRSTPTWFHPLHREDDAELSRLWRKGSGYTEREKGYVLDRQIDIMATVIPEYRRVGENDGGEVTSSPMNHPIRA